MPRHARLRDAVNRWVEPRASGLPNLAVVTVIPSLLIVAAVVLIALGISGTSGGVYWETFGLGVDPALIAGEARGIRSDEWLVQSSWIVSQVQQGFPVVNQTLPGGMDATIQNDLPTSDWSTAFRPHVIGFLFLSLDSGMAVRWWLPVLAVVVAGYLFVVSLLPRHPFSALAIAVGMLLSPIVQWWLLPTTLWPLAFAFLTMTTIVCAYRTRRRWVNWTLAAASGYVAVAMAMSIYVPFMVPAVIAVLFFAVGAMAQQWPGGRGSLWRVLRPLVPLAIAAVAAAGVLALWVVTRLDTVDAVTSTVYPGERLEVPGQLDTVDEAVALFSAPFQRVLLYDLSAPLAPNQSEAAAPLMLAVFLIPALLWAASRRASADRRSRDLRIVAVVASILFVGAFLLLPAWDAVAHLVLIDRTSPARIRMFFVIAGVVGLVLLLRRLQAERRRVPWVIAVLSALLAVAASLIVSASLTGDGSQIPAAGRAWVVSTVLLALAVLAASRARPLLASLSLLGATAIVAWGVNPLYDGVFDLRETDVGEDVAAISAADPDGRWVGIGGYVPTAVLVQSGVPAYNGVQTYPPEEMWDAIDPTGEYEEQWNRLANVNWAIADGEPTVLNPVRDQIVVTFDSCSDFAGENVEFVLSDLDLGSQECLGEVAVATEGPSTMRIYEVIDESGPRR
ncbi:DUF7657 domain-containing protein [Marisediminicola senii]|uniref:DUF7657 domain-containing protein n=1 Tax=Marisediminicola senii TaxID=2711233 RepID=UPI0013EA53AC|nr:hypothetical protein [Marisediminicola senii]